MAWIVREYGVGTTRNRVRAYPTYLDAVDAVSALRDVVMISARPDNNGHYHATDGITGKPVARIWRGPVNVNPRRAA